MRLPGGSVSEVRCCAASQTGFRRNPEFFPTNEEESPIPAAARAPRRRTDRGNWIGLAAPDPALHKIAPRFSANVQSREMKASAPPVALEANFFPRSEKSRSLATLGMTTWGP